MLFPDGTIGGERSASLLLPSPNGPGNIMIAVRHLTYVDDELRSSLPGYKGRWKALFVNKRLQ